MQQIVDQYVQIMYIAIEEIIFCSWELLPFLVSIFILYIFYVCLSFVFVSLFYATVKYIAKHYRSFRF